MNRGRFRPDRCRNLLNLHRWLTCRRRPHNMILQAFFWYFAIMMPIFAFLVISRKNPVHCVLWMLVFSIHSAALFLFSECRVSCGGRAHPVCRRGSRALYLRHHDDEHEGRAGRRARYRGMADCRCAQFRSHSHDLFRYQQFHKGSVRTIYD